jgi:hypothetical protein
MPITVNVTPTTEMRRITNTMAKTQKAKYLVTVVVTDVAPEDGKLLKLKDIKAAIAVSLGAEQLTAGKTKVEAV